MSSTTKLRDIDRTHKECKRCNKLLHVDLFRFVRRKKHYSGCCIECERIKAREAHARKKSNPDYIKNERERYLRWKSKPGNKDKANERTSASAKKAAQSRKEQRLLLPETERNIGKVSNITYDKCYACGIIKVRQGIKSNYLCYHCKARFTSYIRNSINKTWFRECTVCMTGFNPFLSSHDSFCSNDCKYEAKKRQARKARKRNGGHRGRAKAHGVHYEPFNVTKVYDRDKWKCVQCGVKVVRKRMKRGEYIPNIATIDHVIPMSKGGPHVPENCQTMCIDCNSKKGDIVTNTQMTIFNSA